MRVLIVDDELVSRTKMEALMSTFAECRVAESGRRAIRLFEAALVDNKAFDLITLDINMPDMRGTEVLNKIRGIERERDVAGIQHTAVMMVTSHSDQDLVRRCIASGCDDYLTKPFNIKIIQSKLRRLGLMPQPFADESDHNKKNRISKSEKIFQDINRALRAGRLSLPVLPHIGFEFRKLVHSQANMEAMAALLKQDMYIASNVIRIANSAMYRGYSTVRTIDQAISRLGLSSTVQMVEAFANRRLYAVGRTKYRGALERLWRHALACAFTADALFLNLARPLNFDAFTAGLLHDIGALALIQIIAEMEQRGRFSDPVDDQAFLETVTAHHALFGAKLLEKWNFDASYVRAALFHASPQTADFIDDELLIVHFANLAAKALGFTTFEQTTAIVLAQSDSAIALGLDDDDITALQQCVAARMAQAAEIIN